MDEKTRNIAKAKTKFPIEAVRVRYAERTANGYEGPLFDSFPAWLQKACDEGKVVIANNRETDYVTLSLPRRGETAGPGDRIIRNDLGEIVACSQEAWIAAAALNAPIVKARATRLSEEWLRAAECEAEDISDERESAEGVSKSWLAERVLALAAEVRRMNTADDNEEGGG